MMLKKFLYSLVMLITVSSGAVMAQCAMCRATVENNVSNGDVGIAAGLNVGILYLLIMPYLAFAVVGYFWYKNSKANATRYEQL